MRQFFTFLFCLLFVCLSCCASVFPRGVIAVTATDGEDPSQYYFSLNTTSEYRFCQAQNLDIGAFGSDSQSYAFGVGAFIAPNKQLGIISYQADGPANSSAHHPRI